jgi:hypothetical protein
MAMLDKKAKEAIRGNIKAQAMQKVKGMGGKAPLNQYMRANNLQGAQPMELTSNGFGRVQTPRSGSRG